MTRVGGSLPLLAFLSLAACAGAPTGPALQRASTRILEDSVLGQAHWGMLVVDPREDRIVLSVNAARKFVPASNAKILTGAAALSLLGPEYRYRTALGSRAPLVDGVLGGDLVLTGRGDPTLGPPFHEDADAALDVLADSLRQAGVRRVRGDLVLDLSAWDSTAVAETWMVGDLPFRWAATGGPFAVGLGELALELRAGSQPGAPVTVGWGPVGDPDFVQSRLITAPRDSFLRVRPRFLAESRRIVLDGTVPAGAVDTVRLSVRDPARQGGLALLRAFARRGVRVEGGLRLTREPEARCGGAEADCRELASLASPPLSEIVEAMLGPSQNWIADQLLMTLGAEEGEGGSWEAGIARVERWTVEEAGADSLDVSLRDGSGLSAYNLVTPRALVAVLLFMRRSAAATEFRKALAEPGEENGTLEDRLLGLEGRLWAKTGTITHVDALSGYLLLPDGRHLIFSVLANGSGLPSSRVRETIDRLVAAAAGDPG